MDPDSSMSSTMAHSKSHNLFQVYLRLRPHQAGATATGDRFLAVEEAPHDHTPPTHITLNPPSDRRRAIEKFAFTQVFEEDSTQLDVFHCTGVVPLVEGVLAPHGGDGTDALLATLGVTGSGKTHTILGSRSQRGLTQLALDVIFRSLGTHILDSTTNPYLEASVTAADASEAAVFSAAAFLETVYADMNGPSRLSSRAPTPMIVRTLNPFSCVPVLARPESALEDVYHMPGNRGNLEHIVRGADDCPKSVRMVSREDSAAPPDQLSTPPSYRHGFPKHARSRECAPAFSRGMVQFNSTAKAGTTHHPQRQAGMPVRPKLALKSPTKHYMAATASVRQKDNNTKAALLSKGDHHSSTSAPPPTPRRLITRPSALPQNPDVSAISVSCDPAAEYTVLISMYEVYNDRIFDLLTPPIKSAATKEYRRRPLLFKSTEMSPDRKVVAGLRKIVCSNLGQALMVLEAGLHERRVAGTGSNSVSSRSHGFFCIEVRKRLRGRRPGTEGAWGGSTLTIVDLAGSERARDAKTAGATLAEAGKINESLMYLGQCLQMQSDAANKDKPNVVPFRQCKLTELLFSNSFPSSSQPQTIRRNPQKAVMIVTADPHGDFNATSQILRYSALAREITVPRIPSITQTILAAATASTGANVYPPPASSSDAGSPLLHHRPFFPPGSTASSATYVHPHPSPNVQRTFSPLSSPGSDERATMELAALEIARLAEEVEYLRGALAAERDARVAAEAHLLSMEDRMVDLEAAVREDCAAEYERRVEMEVARWKASMAVEMERGEEHWGRKIEVFERTVAITVTGGDEATRVFDENAGGEDKENILIEDVNEENDRLRRDNETLRRDLAALSPTKRRPLQERGSEVGGGSSDGTGSPKPSRGAKGVNGASTGSALHDRMERLRVSEDGLSVRSSSGDSPKKMRKLATQRWDCALDQDDLF